MLKSELDAKTFGIGELITQRKLFEVPEHQRNFSWSSEEIEQYLIDVAEAMRRGAPDYFIGLVVLQGPIDGTWHILDGQQRLATTTMIYSAIRSWLKDNNLEADSRQIENEFIGVRHLGGRYNPRLKLNTDNRVVFEKYVTSSASSETMRKAMSAWPKRSSNYQLIEGALFCRDWIYQYVETEETIESAAARLFSFASYFENKVKVVCVDVSSQTDAYILFESLNDRGADLSALDLVKNYIFSQIRPDAQDLVLPEWRRMAKNIEGRDADDFLKVFWTSKFGVIQKLDLFNRLRSVYPGEQGARLLVMELSDASIKYEAIDDPEHELWAPFGWICRQRIRDLKVLGNRQSRPLILGALTYLPAQEIASFLWLLVVLVMRYQVIGRGRTGIMEKEFSILARAIHDRHIQTAEDAHRRLAHILPEDEDFQLEFKDHSESKSSRVHYILLELEASHRLAQGKFALEDYVNLRSKGANLSPQFIAPKTVGMSEEADALVHLISNRILLEDDLDIDAHRSSFQELGTFLQKSEMLLTQDVIRFGGVADENIYRRSLALARLAVVTWRFDNEFHNSAGILE